MHADGCVLRVNIPNLYGQPRQSRRTHARSQMMVIFTCKDNGCIYLLECHFHIISITFFFFPPYPFLLFYTQSFSSFLMPSIFSFVPLFSHSLFYHFLLLSFLSVSFLLRLPSPPLLSLLHDPCLPVCLPVCLSGCLV